MRDHDARESGVLRAEPGELWYVPFGYLFREVQEERANP